MCVFLVILTNEYHDARFRECTKIRPLYVYMSKDVRIRDDCFRSLKESASKRFWETLL